MLSRIPIVLLAISPLLLIAARTGSAASKLECTAIRDFEQFTLSVTFASNSKSEAAPETRPSVRRWGLGKRAVWRVPVDGRTLAAIDPAKTREVEVTRLLKILDHKEIYVELAGKKRLVVVKCDLGLTGREQVEWKNLIQSGLDEEQYEHSESFPYSKPIEFEWDPGDQQRWFAVRLDFFDFVYRLTKDVGNDERDELAAFEGTEYGVAGDLVSADFVFFDGSRKVEFDDDLGFARPTNLGRSWLQEYEVNGSIFGHFLPRAAGATLGFNGGESETVDGNSEWILSLKYGLFLDFSDALGVETGFLTAIAGTGDFDDRDDTAFYAAARVRPEILAKLAFKSGNGFRKFVWELLKPSRSPRSQHES